MARIDVGDRVTWAWGRGEAEGRVVEIHAERTIRVLKGSRIVRNGSADDPALVIEQASGARVLKLRSEVVAG